MSYNIRNILTFTWPIFLLHRRLQHIVKMPEPNPNATVLRDLIEKTGRYYYHIEYNRYWTNHVMHALIAQHQLGASDEHLEKVAKAHIDDGLVPPRLSEKKLIITKKTWKDYLGKKEHFVELAEFFDREYQIRFNSDQGHLLHEYLPQLIDGISGALTHGIIHLGFSLRSPSLQSISDALAYLVFSYRSLGHIKPSSSTHDPVDPSEGCREFLELLEFVRQDVVSNETSFSDDDDEKSHLRLQQYAKRLTSIEGVKDEHLHELAHSLCLGALLAYASTTETSDNFYLLHAVTSGWALRQCLKYFDQDHVQFIRTALYDYTMAVLSVYLSQNAPEIRLRNDSHQNDLPSWDEIIKRAVASMDEHLTKLVFICYDDECHYGAPASNIYHVTAARKVGLVKWNDD